MPTFALLERQRVRARGRARPNAPGNYVAARIFAQWYSLTMNKTEKHYLASIPAKEVYSKAIGYQDNPAPRPPWVPIASIGNPQQLQYPSEHVEPPRVPPTNVPPNTTVVLPLAGRPGSQGVFIPGTSPAQLYATKIAIRRVTVIADSANALTIWTGYFNGITAGNAFPLAPGAARDYDIDDLSQLWILGENATDQVFFIFEI